MEYITTATTGNATDFGDMSGARTGMCGVNDRVRGVFGGGYTGAKTNIIEYITIATTGNTTDFGDMISVKEVGNGGFANDVRGVMCGGNTAGGYVDEIDYVTIQSAGNATDFGNLQAGGADLAGADGN